MKTQSRIKPEQLSRKQLDDNTVQARYKAGYGFFVVNSKFSYNKSFSDLLYDILMKRKEKSFSTERHDS